MKVGDFVTVAGKSQLGKNRVNEHGTVWKVRKIWANKTLLESLDGETYLKWVDGPEDIDLTIVNTVNPDNL